MTRALTPAIKPPIVQARKVSGTERLLNRFTTQNPESFGSDSPTPPAQIARPTRTGETPSSNTIGPIILDVVTSATVVDPERHVKSERK